MVTRTVKQDEQTVIYETDGAVGATLELDVQYPASHWFVGFDFFTDEELTTPVTPSAGTVVVTAQLSVSDVDQTLTNGTIDATTTDLIADFTGNPDKITCTPAGITGANFYRARAVGNRS